MVTGSLVKDIIKHLDSASSAANEVILAQRHGENAEQYLTGLLNHVEQATLMARQAYACLADGREVMRHPELVLPVHMEDSEYGPVITIPALLPLRRKDGKYIRTTLQGLCSDKGRSFLRDVVVAVEEKYSDGTPLRQWRDHDNVELAGVLNEMSLWVLAGDNPADVDLFQFATKGEQNVTVIHVIARAKFPDWVVKKWGKTVKIKETDFTPRPPPICIADTGVFERLHEPTVVERYTWIG